MSSTKVSIEAMAETINKGLEEYATLTQEALKSAVQQTAKSVKSEIQQNAPVNTGKYKASWTTKKQSETSNSISMVVYSKNRYQLAHLLENGHALRSGGRVAARPHIAPAEENGEALLLSLLEQAL